MPSAKPRRTSTSSTVALDTNLAYDTVIHEVFFRHFCGEANSFLFARDDLIEFCATEAVKKLNGGNPVANPGDVVYCYRSRRDLPQSILQTQRDGLSWRIQLAGRAKAGSNKGRTQYRFVLGVAIRIEPNPALATIDVPDATPEIIKAYALTDEQALLAKVRYNRLIDIFLGIATYSLQNHLRTAVQDMGQIEIDELYVGLDKEGRHYVVPVQAKGGTDKLTPAQTEQDIAFCEERFPDLICRPVSAQFMSGDRIALFELRSQSGEIRIAEERHYRLVPASSRTGR